MRMTTNEQQMKLPQGKTKSFPNKNKTQNEDKNQTTAGKKPAWFIGSHRARNGGFDLDRTR